MILILASVKEEMSLKNHVSLMSISLHCWEFYFLKYLYLLYYTVTRLARLINTRERDERLQISVSAGVIKSA